MSEPARLRPPWSRTQDDCHHHHHHHHQSYAPQLSVKKASVETYDDHTQSPSSSYSKGSSTGASKSSYSSYGGRGQGGSSVGRGAHSRYGGFSGKGKKGHGSHMRGKGKEHPSRSSFDETEGAYSIKELLKARFYQRPGVEIPTSTRRCGEICV